MKAFHKTYKFITGSMLFLLFYFYIYNLLKKIKAIKHCSKKQSIQHKQVCGGFLFGHMFSPWSFGAQLAFIAFVTENHTLKI